MSVKVGVDTFGLVTVGHLRLLLLPLLLARKGAGSLDNMELLLALSLLFRGEAFIAPSVLLSSVPLTAKSSMPGADSWRE